MIEKVDTETKLHFVRVIFWWFEPTLGQNLVAEINEVSSGSFVANPDTSIVFSVANQIDGTFVIKHLSLSAISTCHT